MDKQDGQVELTEEQRQALREELAGVVAEADIRLVLQRVLHHGTEHELDLASCAFLGAGLEMGIELAFGYPEWAQALFLRLNPTLEERERSVRGLRLMTELIPMRVEQTREV